MERIGRKYTVMVASPFWILSWALIATAQRWEFIFAGRLITGFFDGLSLPAAQIYVTECCNPKIRGVLGTFPAFAMSIGVTYAYIEGTLFSWVNVAWINCGICAALILFVFLLPDSPIWLRHKGKLDQAKQAAEWLNLENFTVDEGIKVVTERDEQKLTWKIFTSRRIFRPMMVSLTLLAIQQLSGIDAIVFYTVEMFRAAGVFYFKILIMPNCTYNNLM